MATRFHAKSLVRAFNSFTISSGSYVTLLDVAAGQAFSITLTKAAGTSLLVLMDTFWRAASASSAGSLAVSDGTTDYELARNQAFVTGSRRNAVGGAVMIPASGAGSVTLSARGAIISGTSLTMSADILSMQVFECGAGFVNAACLSSFGGVFFTTTSTTYVDVTNGGAISASITKRATANKVIAGGRCGTACTTNNTSVALGVSDGTLTTDLGSAIAGGSYFSNIAGENYLTGHAAGSPITLTPRMKTAAGTGQCANSLSLWAIEVPS